MSKWTLQIPFDVKKSPFDTKYLQRNKSRSKRGLWLQWRKKVLLTFLWNFYYPEDTTDICNYHRRYRCWRTFFHKDSNKNINDAINTTTNMSTKSWKTLQILSQGNLCWKIMQFGFFRFIICGKRQISGTAWKVVFRFLKSLNSHPKSRRSRTCSFLPIAEAVWSRVPFSSSALSDFRPGLNPQFFLFTLVRDGDNRLSCVVGSELVRFPNCIVYYQRRGWGPWLDQSSPNQTERSQAGP